MQRPIITKRVIAFMEAIWNELKHCTILVIKIASLGIAGFCIELSGAHRVYLRLRMVPRA